MNIKIVITNVDYEYQPGWAECRFSDIYNKEHIVEEKLPIVTEEYIDENTPLPKGGFISCSVIKRWVDANGRNIVTVNIEEPLYVETTEGIVMLDLYESQLQGDEWFASRMQNK